MYYVVFYYNLVSIFIFCYALIVSFIVIIKWVLSLIVCYIYYGVLATIVMIFIVNVLEMHKGIKNLISWKNVHCNSSTNPKAGTYVG